MKLSEVRKDPLFSLREACPCLNLTPTFPASGTNSCIKILTWWYLVMAGHKLKQDSARWDEDERIAGNEDTTGWQSR